MEPNYLRKEAELRKENKQLEQRTKELLQQVDNILATKMRDLQFEDLCLTSKTKPIETKELNVPKSVDEMGTKGMIHFYKSKLKAVQDDLEKVRAELKIKSDELKREDKNYQSVYEEKEKWFLQYNVEKNNNAKLEKLIATCNSKLQLKENENIALKKELDQLKSELKNCASELSASEGRLKRAVQESEKMKTNLKNMRHEDKETKESYRQNLKELTSTVKQIQKHKNELLHGYKKQIQLIDNLKRQKVCIESSKVLELAECDFFKILDWKID